MHFWLIYFSGKSDWMINYSGEISRVVVIDVSADRRSTMRSFFSYFSEKCEMSNLHVCFMQHFSPNFLTNVRCQIFMSISWNPFCLTFWQMSNLCLFHTVLFAELYDKCQMSYRPVYFLKPFLPNILKNVNSLSISFSHFCLTFWQMWNVKSSCLFHETLFA